MASISTEAEMATKKRLVGKVLVVEDETPVASAIQSKLRMAGLHCDIALDLKSALGAIKDRVYHAVITDIFLGSSEPQGLELIKEVEKLGTPVIVMSSNADLHIAKEAMNHGALYLFEKPFQISELLNTLEKIWESPRGLSSLVDRFLDIHHLTPKEKEVVRLILKGLSNKEVADIEGNSDRTIKFHLTTIFEKCGVKSRTELFNAIFPN